MSYLETNFVKTAIALLVLGTCYLGAETWVNRKVEGRRKRLQVRAWVRNSIWFIGFCFLVKIWVEGFGHLLTVVSIVSAALTVVQKENILNLTGWLIIVWRNAFSEGDFICIGERSGFVQSIGWLHFTIEEAKENLIQAKTGKLVKIPNSFVSEYPITILSAESFTRYRTQFVFDFKSPVSSVEAVGEQVKEALASYLNTLTHGYHREELWAFKRLEAKGLHEPSFSIRIFQDNFLKGYSLIVVCHVLARDMPELELNMHQWVLDAIKPHKSLRLATNMTAN